MAAIITKSELGVYLKEKNGAGEETRTLDSHLGKVNMSKPGKHLFFSKNVNFSPFLLYMHTSLHIIVLETTLFYRAKQKSYQQPEFDRIVRECGRGQKPTHTGIIQKPQSYLLAN